ncbi:MAG TPA: glycogen debranching enzyme GlgX, partial [Acetobacteraceae bacterium]|nr:glycogen debranching enzyme GlgX [Acetobacteraceae bacterium]
NRAFTAFTARLIGLRRDHPALRSPTFPHGRHELAADVIEIAWFDEGGAPVSADAWNNPEQRTLVLRRAVRLPDGRLPLLTLLLNPTANDRRFVLPPPALPSRTLIDTAAPDAPEREIEGAALMVAARSAVLVVADAGEMMP